MQNKLNALTDIISTIKNARQRSYALSIVQDLINIINNQEEEIKGLMSWKTNTEKSGCELQKYVLLLILYGYSQAFINSIRIETLIFIAKNKDKFDSFQADEIKTIDLMLMNFEFDNDKMPDNYQEFKTYYDKVKS